MESDGASFSESSEEGYKSFVQNELQNIYSNMSQLEEQDIEDITFAEINKKRIEHAIRVMSARSQGLLPSRRV